MGDRSCLLHRGKLGDKEEKRKTGDRRNPPDFLLSGALWEHRNRHELSSAPSAAYRLREEENPGSWFASLLSSRDPRRTQGVCLQNAYPRAGWKGKTSRAKWAAGVTLTSRHKGLDAGIGHLLPPLLQHPSRPLPSSYPACLTHTCLKASLVQQSGVCSAPEELFGCPLLALRPETVVSLLRLRASHSPNPPTQSQPAQFRITYRAQFRLGYDSAPRDGAHTLWG